MQQVTRTLTAAEILAIETTAIELVPAPGPSLILIPHSLTAKIHSTGMTQYANGSQLNLYLGIKANALLFAAIPAALVLNAADKTQAGIMTAASSVNDVSAKVDNVAINIAAVGAAFITGTGTLTITLFYSTGKAI